MQESEVRQVNIGTPYTKYLDYDDVFIHRFRSFGLWNTTSDALIRDTEVLRARVPKVYIGRDAWGWRQVNFSDSWEDALGLDEPSLVYQ